MSKRWHILVAIWWGMSKVGGILKYKNVGVKITGNGFCGIMNKLYIFVKINVKRTM